MSTKIFDVKVDDCFGDDYGIYFGNHYWFISGYTPVSSYHPIASAKIRCHIKNLCPAGERQVIDIGETKRFDAGYDVRVNSLNIDDVNTIANITVTEVYIDLCEGVVCENICDIEGYGLYSQKCIDGECVPDQLIEEYSEECGYISPDEPNNLILYSVIGLSVLIGLKLLSKK